MQHGKECCLKMQMSEPTMHSLLSPPFLLSGSDAALHSLSDSTQLHVLMLDSQSSVWTGAPPGLQNQRCPGSGAWSGQGCPCKSRVGKAGWWREHAHKGDRGPFAAFPGLMLLTGSNRALNDSARNTGALPTCKESESQWYK